MSDAPTTFDLSTVSLRDVNAALHADGIDGPKTWAVLTGNQPAPAPKPDPAPAPAQAQLAATVRIGRHLQLHRATKRRHADAGRR